MKTRLYDCPDCDNGYIVPLLYPRHQLLCSLCHGTGVISDATMNDLKRGQELRAKRVAKGLSMMQWAKRHGLTTRYVSDAETGRQDPSALERTHL